ncbi:MAG: type II toxin-antitoxin system RelE/ParE family toxin [Eubacterium sp.]
MDDYRVVVTEHAVSAMEEIRNYISDVLMNPGAAIEHMKLFVTEIQRLSDNPGRLKPIDEQPWHDIGVRKIRVKNFYIYYWVEDEKHIVHITDVIYVRSDQPKKLDKMPME